MRYIRVFTISLALHLILALVIYLMPVSLSQRPRMRQTTYVDLLEKPELKRRPHQEPRDTQSFIRSAPAPAELLTKENKPKRFASEDEQNVLEETKAQANGLTVNRNAQGSDGPKSSFALKKTPRKMNAKTASQLDLSPTTPLERLQREVLEDKDGVGGVKAATKQRKPSNSDEVAHQPQTTPQDKTIPNKDLLPDRPDGSRPLILPGFAGAERGISTIGNDLPDDVKIGSFTALNTDRHLYYSFYSRMEEAIRYRWENYVKAALYEYETGAQKLQPKDKWTTRLEIILEPDGTFERAMMSEGSGVKSFDIAPVQAFREAAKFPNPPHEMVKDDNKIHIYFSFTIDVVPRYATRNNNAG